MRPITRDRLRAAAFSHAAVDVRVCETHLSFVVLTGVIAYKVKKALKLDFVDASSVERRRELCEEELRVNRRFAAELYLSVVPIVVINDRLAFDAVGPPIDYAVKMRQFDPSDEMQALLQENHLVAADLEMLGERIAAIHASSVVLHDANHKGAHSFVQKAQENLASLASLAGMIGAEPQVNRLSVWTQEILEGQMEALLARERHGFIRECHGDLHTGNIVRWNGRLTAFDAIEFDADLRFTDVLSDAAFLFMDLIAKHSPGLAYAFLNRYLECTGDYTGLHLLPCFAVYRALVRAKVELISQQQQERTDQSFHAESAQAFLDCAQRFSEKSPPLLIVMHGASGSGKSWLSEQLVPKLPAVRIRSDVERKRLAGIAPADLFAEAPREIYTLEFNQRTYAHLLECSRQCLRGGLSVIVDAAFLKADERLSFASLAIEENAQFSIVSCEADPETLRTRITQRRAAGKDPSDANVAVMLRQLETMDSFVPEEESCLLRIDTGAADATAKALQHLRRPPAS